MTQPRKADSLRPILNQVEEQLNEKLTEACHVNGAAEETTMELERLGDTLNFAAQAAKAAAALRRRIREVTIMEHLERKQGEVAGPPTGAAESA